MTKPTLMVSLALIHVLVGAASVAAAKEPVWGSAETRVTALSGSNGTAHLVEILEFPFHRHVGLDAIWIEESHDRPCRIYLLPKALGEESEPATTIVSGCSLSLPIDLRTASVGGSERPLTFIHGISTCNSKNDDNDRIKGVRVFGAKIWKTERRIDERVPLDLNDDHFEKTNCDKDTWTSPKFCDEGFVASGLNVHREEESIVGLALRCREVDW
jgi:hypothetical protein